MINKKPKLPARKDVHPAFRDETGDNESGGDSSESASNVGPGFGGVRLQGHAKRRHDLIARDRVICLALVLAGGPDLFVNIPRSDVKNVCVHVCGRRAAED